MLGSPNLLLRINLAVWTLWGAGVDARPAAAQSAQAGAVAGTVVARTTGQPIAGATVAVEGADLSAPTNAVGRFRLDGVPARTVTLMVRAPGFLEMRVTDVAVRAGETAASTIVMEPTPNFLERVQVTATKAPLSIGNVPAQADIVERLAIERRGDQSLVQAIEHVPGVVVATQLGSFESVQLRGMPRGGDEFTNTLLLIDGVPQVDSRNTARVVALPIHDANSIEVVRGPNSALYGRTAIGGSVNVRTADPTPEPQFGAEFTVGGFETAKGLARASGPVGHWGGYYVSAASERSGGFYKSRTTDFLTDRSSLFAKLTFAPDERSAGFVSVGRAFADDSTPTNEPFVGGRLLHEIDPRFDRLSSFNIPGPNYHQAEGRVTVNYMRQLAPWARAVEIFGYRAVAYDFINDGDVIGAPFDFAANTLTMLPFAQTRDEDIFYEELRFELTPRFGGFRNTLTIGGSYEWNSGVRDTDLIGTAASAGEFTINYLNPVIPSKDTWVIEPLAQRVYHLGLSALFFQYMLEPASRLMVLAGGRYDHLDLDNRRGSGALLEKTYEAFSPKVSATVKLAGVEAGSPATVNLYGTYSQAFLPPRAPVALAAADVNVGLQPEDIENYEVGLKGSVLGGRVALEATYFRMTEDGVELTTRQGPFFVPTNAGRLKYKGVETGLRWMPSASASAYVNASFYRNRFGEFVIESAGGDTVLTGNRLAISPDQVINAGATFTPVPQVEVALDVKHVGDTATDRENTFTIGAYTLVDAAVSWRRGPLRLTLSASNVFDQEYYWSGGSETLDPGRPRQVLLTTAVLFR